MRMLTLLFMLAVCVALMAEAIFLARACAEQWIVWVGALRDRPRPGSMGRRENQAEFRPTGRLSLVNGLVGHKTALDDAGRASLPASQTSRFARSLTHPEPRSAIWRGETGSAPAEPGVLFGPEAHSRPRGSAAGASVNFNRF
jgi:hypothetical protein